MNNAGQSDGQQLSMSDSGYSSLPPDTTPTPSDQSTLHLVAVQGLTRYEKDVDKSTIKFFEDIVGRLKGPLLTELRKTRKQFRPMAIRLLVLGKDERSAKPWIVVFCPECVSEVVKKYFRKDVARRLCQPDQPGLLDLEVVVEGQPPRPKATEQPPPVTVALGRSIDDDQQYSTTRIKVDGNEGTRYATMGGFIVVVQEDGAHSIYGLTAGHALIQDSIEGYGPSEEEVDKREIQEARPATSISYAQSNDSGEEVVWSGSGSVAQASYSTQACNRDWALIEEVENFASLSHFSENIVEYFFLDDTRFGFGTTVEVIYQPSCFGRLSRSPSFTLLPFGHDFVRAHTMMLQDGQELSPGTSGAWITNEKVEWPWDNRDTSLRHPEDKIEKTIRVHGQIVADDVLGDVYMIPLIDILEDIKEVLTAREAWLPKSSLEIEARLRRPDDSTNIEPAATSTQVSGALNDTAAQPLYPSSMATCRRCGSTQHMGESCGTEPSRIVSNTSQRRSNTTTLNKRYLPVMAETALTKLKLREHCEDDHLWYCCQCGGPNSVPVDAGCAICSDHWRCYRCKTEEVKGHPG